MLSTTEQALFERFKQHHPGATEDQFLEKRNAAKAKFSTSPKMVRLPGGGFFSTSALTPEDMRLISSEIQPPDR